MQSKGDMNQSSQSNRPGPRLTSEEFEQKYRDCGDDAAARNQVIKDLFIDDDAIAVATRHFAAFLGFAKELWGQERSPDTLAGIGLDAAEFLGNGVFAVDVIKGGGEGEPARFELGASSTLSKGGQGGYELRWLECVSELAPKVAATEFSPVFTSWVRLETTEAKSKIIIDATTLDHRKIKGFALVNLQAESPDEFIVGDPALEMYERDSGEQIASHVLLFWLLYARATQIASQAANN